MKANACYLCSRVFGFVHHRRGSKQFCSKKCLEKWRAGVDRVVEESVKQQERQRRFLGLACADWLTYKDLEATSAASFLWR